MQDMTRTMIKAGVLGQLCMRHHLAGVGDYDWSDTRFYAIREFRDVPVDVIDELIEQCKIAHCKAMEINRARRS